MQNPEGGGFNRNRFRRRGDGRRWEPQRGPQNVEGNTQGHGWRHDENRGGTNRTNRRNENRQNRERRPERTMGFTFVQKLLNNENLEEVMLRISDDKSGFSQVLESKDMSNDFIVSLVRLVWKICGSTFQDVKISILIVVLNSRFMEKLKLYISEIASQGLGDKIRNKHFWDNPDSFWENLLKISKLVIEVIPTKCENVRKLLISMNIYFPLIETAHGISISDEVKVQTTHLLDLVEKTVQDMKVKKAVTETTSNEENLEPPDNFQDIPIIPSAQEMVSDFSPFLRQNIVDKSYRSINDYLDIQFRLLREDFVAPLRRGISTYLRNQSKPKNEWKKLENIKVYTAVRFLSVETVNESHCYRIRYDFSRKKRSFNYENSKRFMFGSLVCFTSDNFKTVLFGKIVQRDVKLLEQGLLIVGFQEEVNINYELDYIMVESSVYFEPYYQVLNVLKGMDQNHFPMERYIIHVRTDSQPPGYLIQQEPVFYEIEDHRFLSLEIPSNIRFYNLNDSQLTAFRAALNEEFCIIQGPPGTGKTFLGLKIAHTLLENRLAWYKQTPMLVICYTNHALDQFLEGIIPITENILRVGGQSKNENLSKYSLSNQRRRETNQAAVYQKRDEVRYLMEQIKSINDMLSQIDANESILNFECFNRAVEGFESTWFATAKADDVKRWLLEGNQIRNREAPTNVNNQLQHAEQERQEDLVDNPNQEEDNGVDDWFDDILDEVTERKYIHLISLKQLTDKLDILQNNLVQVVNERNNLANLLKEERIRLEIWETENDLYYISEQLKRYADPRNRRQPRNVDLKNPFNIQPEDRWRLYFSWVEEYANHLRRSYTRQSIRFREVFRVYKEMRDIEDTNLMRRYRVIGMTTTGAARLQSSLQALKCPIVIVEEAAEVLEAHIVAALTSSCQHLILIGDHLQLKPGAADYRIETKYKLGVSLFERMVNNNIHCYTLNVQHRMRPEVSALIKPHIYTDLKDHESTLNRAPILGVENSVYFIDHQEPEEMCQDSSKKNIHECRFLIALARHLILNGYKPQQVTILSAYLGQFFEMMREKRKPNNHMLLQDVRIAVLDNYQGEESDIILLSLVRSNVENKAGFLKIQNRVCVALSRARDGFYIMGNMSLLLKCESENGIWEKIKAVLEKQNAIGSHLTLRCQIHQYRVSQVAKYEDFDNLSEGGCNLMCQADLPCGHVCKRLCHVQDREHESSKCNEPCTKTLCNDATHICRKLCYEECGPCTYLVPRDLDCGHNVNIECHIDPSKYKCQTMVFTKLPCSHEAYKPCSVDPNLFKCPHPCDTRVEPCGHTCDRLCHIRMDPDHLQFKCRQPCAKPKLGCRQPDDCKHECTKFCFQECEPCNVGIKKHRSCGHVFTISCRLDVEELECEKPCKKTLPCGHICKNKCLKDCGPCHFLVEKIIPDCQHKIKIKCHKTPERSHCKSRVCPRLLPCGHKCNKPCNKPCSVTECRQIVDCNIKGPCGHTLTKIECRFRQTDDTNLLLELCKEPCGVELKCKHKCRGTCGECMQSRIHQRCNEKCGVPLVCNHECQIPCREACKPCTRPCEMRCKHSKCTKKCGEPCTPCKNPCKRKCVHIQCTRRCGQICNVSPCTERCPKRLKCGHRCVGFCGDPCPPLCRVCDNDELTEIFFGTEDEEDAIFVYLNDCRHTLEQSGLENWLNEGGNEIKFKSCPKCKTNITTTERYSDYVKRAIQDVVNAKKQSYGENHENEKLRNDLLSVLAALKPSNEKLLRACSKMENVFDLLAIRLEPSRNQRRQPINKIELNAIKSKIQMLTHIQQCFKDLPVELQYSEKDSTVLQLKMLLEVLVRSEDHVTNQEIDDLQLEIHRLHRMVQFDKLSRSDKFKNAIALPDVKKLSDNIQDVLLMNRRYSMVIDGSLKNNLIDLASKVDSALIITDKERMEIVNAINLSKGHWFKCPNGHPYAIGECGGAIHTARCVCGATIGGTGHRLLSTNQLAPEMDGATRHAWPGGLH